MAAHVFNPAVPCVHSIPSGMFPGRMVRVQGFVPPGADRFAINLQCGSSVSYTDDVALHFNPRFPELCVVRNELTCRSWGREERAGGLPLMRGKPFEVLILCKQNAFVVTVNGVLFCEFRHRLPYQCVSHVTLLGDVNVQFLGFEGVQAVPCVHSIPGGLYPGRMIRVQGSTPHGADRFEINLQCGPSPGQREDIALHINPRFHQLCVVRNHLTSRGWANEETSGGFPLEAGKPFDALFLCEHSCLKVSLNGAHFCEFSHRLPYQRISHVAVEGDVVVHSIVIDGQERSSYSAPPAYGTLSYAQPPNGYYKY